MHFSKAGSREFGPTDGLRSVHQRDGAAPVILVEIPGQLPDAARCVICIFATRVGLAMQHRRHVVCLFRQQQMKSAICNLTLHSAKDQRYNQFCRMHNVLDPKSTSVNVAGRRAERRGPKTCLQNRKRGISWLPVVCSPVLLALSGMAMTMHTGESLALFHSHADSFVITNDFWSGQFLWATAMNLSHVSCRHS